MSNLGTPSQHPVAVKNRINLALAIVEFLDNAGRDFLTSGFTAAAAAHFGPAVWAEVNRQMGRTSKQEFSALTIATVIGILAAREV